jgi:hypothetical protein
VQLDLFVAYEPIAGQMAPMGHAKATRPANLTTVYVTPGHGDFFGLNTILAAFAPPPRRPSRPAVPAFRALAPTRRATI